MSQNETAAQLSGVGVWQRLSIECPTGAPQVDISKQVARVVKRSGVQEGVCKIFVTHPNAGVLARSKVDSLEIVELMLAFEEQLRASLAEKKELESLTERLAPNVSGRFEIHRGKLALGWGERIFLSKPMDCGEVEILVKIESE